MARQGHGVDTRLEGASFGASMCLALASHLLDLPIASDLVASAAIESDGSLGVVDGLEEKVALVAGSALGVCRLLVAARQADRAKEVVRRLGVDLHVIEASSLAEAFSLAFPDLEGHVSRGWSQEADAIAAAHELFRVAVEGAPRLLHWRGIAAAAGAVADRLDGIESASADAARWEAQIAQAIADRHSGSPTLIEASVAHFGRYPTAVRSRLWAHVVQAAADRDDASARDAIARAERLVPPAPERHADDLQLLGALGRAYAAIGDEGRARILLQEAVEGWRSLFAEFASSFALSELVRVFGVLGDADAVREIEQGAYRALVEDPRTNTTSIAFARASLARAFVQCGAAARAKELLSDGSGFDWDLIPSHLRQGRARWLARAFEALGDREGAARLRDGLAREAQPDRTNLGLARLDGALFEGGDGVAELAAIRADADVARIAGRTRGTPREIARTVQETYRY
jgi:hypothetical protein